MDTITRALQRAKDSALASDLTVPGTDGMRFNSKRAEEPVEIFHPRALPSLVKLDGDLLRYNHIVAFDPHAGPTRHYDILRNQLAQSHPKADPQVIAVAGPKHGCGATVTSINLAWSFARTRARSVMLVDASDSNAGVRSQLGLLKGRWRDTDRASDVEGETLVEINGISMRIMTIQPDSRDHVASRRWLNDEASVVILDLPPLLSSDKAMPYIDLADGIAVVLAQDQTTHAELESCKSLLGRRDGIQYVLNRCGNHGL